MDCFYQPKTFNPPPCYSSPQMVFGYGVRAFYPSQIYHFGSNPVPQRSHSSPLNSSANIPYPGATMQSHVPPVYPSTSPPDSPSEETMTDLEPTSSVEEEDSKDPESPVSEDKTEGISHALDILNCDRFACCIVVFSPYTLALSNRLKRFKWDVFQSSLGSVVSASNHSEANS